MFDYIQSPTTNPNGWYTQDSGSGADYIDQGGPQDISLTTATPEFLKAIGFSGPVLVTVGEGDNRETILNPDIGAYMRANGITLQRKYNGEAADSYTDQTLRNGTPIEGGSMTYENQGNDNAFLAAMLLAGGVVGGAAAGIGAAGAGSAGGAAATGGGLSSADLAALYGAEGYGAGGAGLTTAGSTAGLGGLGMNGADSIAAQLGGQVGAGMAPAEAAGGVGAGAGATNPALIDSFLGTAGYGASSAGAGGGAGTSLLGGLGNYLTSDSGLKTLGNVGSTLINSYQSGKALDAQTDATREANALARYMYDTTRNDWKDYRDIGSVGTKGYANLLQNPSSITSDPGYQFGLTQGQTAIDRSAAGKGSLYSGATLKALNRYGQDYGTTKYGNALDRFGNAAQIGATGVSGSQAAGANYSNTVGNNITGLGNAQAGQALYQGGLYGNALTQGVSAYTNAGKPWWQQG